MKKIMKVLILCIGTSLISCSSSMYRESTHYKLAVTFTDNSKETFEIDSRSRPYISPDYNGFYYLLVADNFRLERVKYFKILSQKKVPEEGVE